MWGRVLTAAAAGVSVTLPSLRGRASAGASLPIRLSTGRLARLAPSSAVLTASETTILATLSHTTPPATPSSFAPLLVDFRAKAAAVGIIPGTWARRELQPALQETLVARLIDRTLRPALSAPGVDLPPTQLTVSVLSSARAPQAPVDVLAVNAAAAAVAASAVPWGGPVAAARVAVVDGDVVLFPTDSVLQRARLSVFVAANRDGRVLALSVESGEGAVPEPEVMSAVRAAVEAACNLIPLQDEFREKVHAMREEEGQSAFPRQMPRPAGGRSTGEMVDQGLLEKVRERATQIYDEAFVECRNFPGKAHRAAVVTRAQQAIVDEFADVSMEAVLEEARRAAKEAHRAVLLRDGVRMDGRRFDELRLIRCETDVLPGDVHGSSLFERGDTQVLACSTIGLKSLAMRTVEYVAGGGDSKSFFVHYSFPPYATGEYGRFAGSSSRREVGHSMLAENAIRPLLDFSRVPGRGNDTNMPSANGDGDVESSYPYSHRLSAEVLASDGSSSMATVCAGSMALMDSGAPLENAVAGVAMGLICGPSFADGNDADYTILTDILGAEDHFGEMDMKVTGTTTGVTACQLDVKPHTGLPVEVIEKALTEASTARSKILEQMECACPAGLRDFPVHAPRVVEVPVDMGVTVKTLMKDRAFGLKEIEDKSGARVILDGRRELLRVEAPNKPISDAAQSLIRDALGNLEIGTKMVARVIEVKPSYAVVNVATGNVSGVLHVSKMQLSPLHQSMSTDGEDNDDDSSASEVPIGTLRYPDARNVLSRGDILDVVVLESDRTRNVLRFGLTTGLKVRGPEHLNDEIDSILAASRPTKAQA